MNNKYMAEYMKQRYYKRRSEWLEKLGGKCIVCGIKDDLEFDHIVESTKEYDIGKILATHSENKIAYEMAKCQLLCKSHHKEKTIRYNSVDHGKGLSGKRNCYCDLCKPLKRQYNIDKGYKGRKQPKEKQSYICGTYRTYKHGCKCVDCKAANTAYMIQYYKNKGR